MDREDPPSSSQAKTAAGLRPHLQKSTDCCKQFGRNPRLSATFEKTPGNSRRIQVLRPDGAATTVRRVLHFQKHGTRTHVSVPDAEVPNRGSPLPDPEADAHALHALLLLHPRRGPRPPGRLCGSFLPFQTTYYLNGHHF